VKSENNENGVAENAKMAAKTKINMCWHRASNGKESVWRKWRNRKWQCQQRKRRRRIKREMAKMASMKNNQNNQ
jgi:hypothetical protein